MKIEEHQSIGILYHTTIKHNTMRANKKTEQYLLKKNFTDVNDLMLETYNVQQRIMF